MSTRAWLVLSVFRRPDLHVDEFQTPHPHQSTPSIVSVAAEARKYPRRSSKSEIPNQTIILYSSLLRNGAPADETATEALAAEDYSVVQTRSRSTSHISRTMVALSNTSILCSNSSCSNKHSHTSNQRLHISSSTCFCCDSSYYKYQSRSSRTTTTTTARLRQRRYHKVRPRPRGTTARGRHNDNSRNRSQTKTTPSCAPQSREDDGGGRGSWSRRRQ